MKLHCSVASCDQMIPEERARRGAHTCSQACTATSRIWHRVHAGYEYPYLAASVPYVNPDRFRSGREYVTALELARASVLCVDPLPVEQLPRCLMCGNHIEQLRAQRQAFGQGAAPTCTQKCKDAYRQWRLEHLREQRCPKCNHPSTPEEWEQFRAWRIQTQGKVRPWEVKKGNPQWEARATTFRRLLDEGDTALDDALLELDPPEKTNQSVEPHLERVVSVLRSLSQRVKASLNAPLPESDYARQKKRARKTCHTVTDDAAS